jgi:predicted acylesterase/phospholipase RssA
MVRIGLALSGGGFRATLYHLGVVRFLRDAKLLDKVTHITSVSGGSIIAAHLVLNWNRYTGTEEEYNQAARELLDFIQLDVRNRVVRRFPLAFSLNGLRWATGLGRSRLLTRPGLLEAHYEKFLYGKKCLYELPAVPQLHILATNVNEGSLCSFSRSGIIAQRRMPSGESRFELVPSAITSVSTAVTASSAFPGFFPPMQLTSKDVGVDESRFAPHLFTDGGVYDNLGVRMFRHIQESWIGHDTPLRPDDFADLPKAAEVFRAAANSGSHTALGRLAELVASRTGEVSESQETIRDEQLPTSLWNVIVHDPLYLDPAFADVIPNDEQAADLLRMARRGRRMDSGDHLWLNRYLVNAVYASAHQGDLFGTVQATFDAVIVSDAGRKFTVSRRTKGGGLIGAAMRSSDILMNRVWQLENMQFEGEADFVFAPMYLTVHQAEDSTALHPEIQHQVTNTRTDLDRFTDLEISGLVRHGYAVMRHVCRSRRDLFGDDLPVGPPWDPTGISENTVSESGANPTTEQARKLQESSQRRILSRLFSLRDWPTYVFVPLLLFLLLGVPYLAYTRYQSSHRSEMIVDAITFSNPDFQLVLELVRQKPLTGEWLTIQPEEVEQIGPASFAGFRLITDTRVLDARGWRRDRPLRENRIVSYRRMLVRRTDEHGGLDSERKGEIGHFSIQQFSPGAEVQIRSSASRLNPIVRMAQTVAPDGESGYMYEAEFDLSSVPAGEDFDIGFEVSSPGVQGRDDRVVRLDFPIIAPTDVATMWVLLPPGQPYNEFEVVGYDPNAQYMVESIEPTYRFEMADGSVFGWMLVAPRDGFTYECRWTWRSP